MGCIISFLYSEGTSRVVIKKCEHHMSLMQKAMKHNQEFFIAQDAYIQTLRNVGSALEQFSKGVVDVHSLPVSISSLDFPQVISIQPLEDPHALNDIVSEEFLEVPTPLLSAMGTPPSEFASMHNVEYSATDVLGSSVVCDLQKSSFLDRGESSPAFYSPRRDDHEIGHAVEWIIESVEEKKMYEEEYDDESVPDLEDIEMKSCIENHEDEWMPALEELEDIDNEIQPQNQWEVNQLNQELERTTTLAWKEGMGEEADCLRYLVLQKDQMGTPQESLSPDTQQTGICSSSNYLMNEAFVRSPTEKFDENIITNFGKDDIIDSEPRQEKFMLHEEFLVAKDNFLVLQPNHRSEEGFLNRNCATLSAVGLHMVTPPHRNLIELLRCIVEQFERVYKSEQCVSEMLVSKDCYPNGSSVVFNAITSYWSLRTDPTMKAAYDENETSVELGIAGSHAATLQLLYTWEKKLYEEVKVAEHTQAFFDLKCGQLSDLIAKDSNHNKTVIDKLRAELKELEAQLFVALNAIQVASMKIESLANQELFSDLHQLLLWLRNMWRVMSECHHEQEKMVSEMEDFEAGRDEFSVAHNDATIHLEHVLREWHSRLNIWFQVQKKYIFNLYAWSQMRYQVNDKRNNTTASSKMFLLLKEWRNSLVNLESQQEEVAASIRNFACEVHLLEQSQSHELKLQRHAEKSDRIVNNQAFSFKNVGMSGRSLDRRTSLKDQTRNSLDLLRQHLPKVFRSLALFAEASWRKYERINRKAENHFVMNEG